MIASQTDLDFSSERASEQASERECNQLPRPASDSAINMFSS